MKKIAAFASLILSNYSAGLHAQEQPAAATPAQEQAMPSANSEPKAGGLNDLAGMTFSCPQAGLNAAAREAAKAPSQGHYQFAYFKIIDDSHHSLYEVHFKSNYQEEADLKYCVSVYCQQGQEPAPSVNLIGKEPQPIEAAKAHNAECGGDRPSTQKSPTKSRSKKKR